MKAGLVWGVVWGLVWGLVSVCEELFHLLFLVGKAWASGLEYWLDRIGGDNFNSWVTDYLGI